jgi:hypothetical protein
MGGGVRAFGRPSGTRASCASGPGDKSPGYCHMSLRDEGTKNLPHHSRHFVPGYYHAVPLAQTLNRYALLGALFLCDKVISRGGNDA